MIEQQLVGLRNGLGEHVREAMGEETTRRENKDAVRSWFIEARKTNVERHIAQLMAGHAFKIDWPDFESDSSFRATFSFSYLPDQPDRFKTGLTLMDDDIERDVSFSVEWSARHHAVIIVRHSGKTREMQTHKVTQKPFAAVVAVEVLDALNTQRDGRRSRQPVSATESTPQK
jgi:hypothetical protein